MLAVAVLRAKFAARPDHTLGSKPADKAVSYAIVGGGGFLGLGKHDVAIPVSQLKVKDGKLVLAGATKDALKAMMSWRPVCLVPLAPLSCRTCVAPRTVEECQEET